MKYEGDAPLYTAWAVIAIESVWPNPDGDELTPDADDLNLYGDEVSKSNYKSRLRQSFGETYSGDSYDYQRTQGYYKILPLNVITTQTQTSVDSGSSWSATFTLDDLVLVTSKDNMEYMRSASGIPMSPSDLIESDIDGSLPYLIHGDKNETSVEYKKDSELGLSRYRISGKNSGFNISDLVNENDTVTIWIYHDPSDFYFKDEIPEEEGAYLIPNDGISSVIGSGDRRSQTNTDSESFDETLLGRLGIINDILSESIETLLASGESEDVTESQVPQIDKSNVHNTARNHLDIIRSSTPVVMQNFGASLVSSVDSTFSDVGPGAKEKILNYLSVTDYPYIIASADDEGAVEEQGSLNERRTLGNRTLSRVVSLLKETGDPEGLMFYMDKDSYTNEEWSNIMGEVSSARLTKLQTDEDMENYIEGLNFYIAAMNTKSQKFASEYLQRRIIARTRQTFINGRTALVDGSHGETPYQALKGVISRVETNIGAGANSFTVTIAGEGLEKALTTNEVYYENVLFPGGMIGPVADHATIYINMTPPDAIRHLVNRWASKQVVVAERNAYTKFLNIASTRLTALGADEEEGEVVDGEDYDKESELEYSKVVVRGYQVQHSKEGSYRVFVPVNYLDTTRLGEMSRAISTVYAETQEDNYLNIPITVDNRRSIYENARKLMGPAQLYEMFVDETGKVRHRIAFEAIERTPKPEYTPTIQDYDLLAEGSTFFHDDTRLATLVDIKPHYSQNVGPTTSWAISGRSIPEPGEVPMQDLGPIEGRRDLIVPEFFKYGLRSITIEDIYQQTHRGAQIKSEIYRQFYGAPIKRASVMLRNSTSYRAGETVLISLQKNKMRSRTLIDLTKFIQWLNYLEGEPELMRMYIGVDARMLQRGKESFVMTAGEYNPFGDSTVTGSSGSTGADLYQEFNKDPHLFVLNQIRDTLLFMVRTIPEHNVVTPDYFPTLYWYFRHKPGGAYGWDENRVGDDYILRGYEYMLRAAVSQDSSSQDALREILTVPMQSVDGSGATVTNIGLINMLRFQNFRAQSYYINSVSHNFSHGNEARTTLSLDYGQDNLVILDPVNLTPFGFISLEKKVKIGYRDASQEAMWSEPYTTQSTMQKLYLEQFKEDDLFKRSSFMYNAQSLRNASNYMYELAVVKEGLNTFSTTLSDSLQKQPLQPNQKTNTGAVSPVSSPLSGPTRSYDKTWEGTITSTTQDLVNYVLGPNTPESPWYDYSDVLELATLRGRNPAGAINEYNARQERFIWAELTRIGGETEQQEALLEFENMNYGEYRGDRLLEFLTRRR